MIKVICISEVKSAHSLIKKNKEYDNRCTFAFVAATRHDGRWPGDKNIGK